MQTVNTSQINLASYIDQTLLRPEANEHEIQLLCETSAQFQFAAVCVSPQWVSRAYQALGSSPTKVATVVGFPSGCHRTEAKVFETDLALQDGADEIDMVLNVGWLKSRYFEKIESEIRRVHMACSGRPLKVIIETFLLTHDEKIIASRLVEAGGAEFVKTCTGFNGGGATVADIALIRSVVSPQMQIKASGGVRSWQQAVDLIEAGASRLGTSSGPALVQGLTAKGNY